MTTYAVITNNTTATLEASHYARNRRGDYIFFEDEDSDPFAEFPSQSTEGIVLNERLLDVGR